MIHFTRSPIIQHTHHGFTFHDRKMANAADGHNGHALVYRLLLSYEDNRAAHNLPDWSLLRRPSLEHDFAGVVTLREDTDQLAFGDHEQEPYLFFSHPLNRFETDCSGVTDQITWLPFPFRTESTVSVSFMEHLQGCNTRTHVLPQVTGRRFYGALPSSGLPIASKKMALFPFACGEKKAVTSSSKKVSPVEPRRWAYAARYILPPMTPASSWTAR